MQIWVKVNLESRIISNQCIVQFQPIDTSLTLK